MWLFSAASIALGPAFGCARQVTVYTTTGSHRQIAAVFPTDESPELESRSAKVATLLGRLADTDDESEQRRLLDAATPLLLEPFRATEQARVLLFGSSWLMRKCSLCRNGLRRQILCMARGPSRKRQPPTAKPWQIGSPQHVNRRLLVATGLQQGAGVEVRYGPHGRLPWKPWVLQSDDIQ